METKILNSENIKLASLPATTELGFLEERNKNYMGNTALTFVNKEITYEEFHTRVDEYARALYKRGVREGDLIALAIANTPEGIYVSYALQKLGAIVVSISPLENKYNFMQDLQIIKPKMFIGINDSYNNFKYASRGSNIDVILLSPLTSLDEPVLKILYSMKNFLTGNFVVSLDKKLSHVIQNGKDFPNPVYAAYKENTVNEIVFTGGSSGLHKGVQLNGNGLNSVVQSLDYVTDIRPGEIFMGNLPQFIAFGKVALHFALANNANVHLTLNAMPKDFKDELYKIKPQGVFAGPIQWEYFINDIFNEVCSEMGGIDFSLLTSKDELEYLKSLEEILKNANREDLVMSWLKMGVSGGEQLRQFTEKVCNLVFRYLGVNDDLWNGLGMTELWAPTAVKQGRLHTFGTVGKIIPYNSYKIVNPETFEDVPKGEIGLLLVTGPGMMLGYYNNPTENEKAFRTIDGQKYYISGDIVRENEHGELEYVDRLKRSFVCGIENIYPQRVENILSTLPEIEEAIVTKIPCNELQYVPKYHISLVSENVDIETLKQKIYKLILNTLGENYLPRYYNFYYEKLPRTQNGKLDPKPLQSKDDKLFIGNQVKKLQRI